MRRNLVATILLVAACADEQPPPPAPAPAAPQPVPYVAPVAVEPAAPPPAFCPALAAVVADEPAGYASLRGPETGRDAWRATTTLPGTERCTVEGVGWPRARLTCEGPVLNGDDPGWVEAEFDRVAAEIDRCLGRASWFPRVWERGQLFEFAMNERQLAWLDDGSHPPTVVVLKVQQDILSGDFQLRINVETIR